MESTADTVETAQGDTAAKKPPKLSASRFDGAEFKRTIYRAVPEIGTPFEHLMEPSYWAHVSSKLRPLDRIEVNAEDGSYFAELLVMSASRTEAIVRKLHYIELPAATKAATDSAGYMVKWAGPIAKYRVLRKHDNKSLQEGFDTADQAQAWLNDHLRAIAA